MEVNPYLLMFGWQLEISTFAQGKYPALAHFFQFPSCLAQRMIQHVLHFNILRAMPFASKSQEENCSTWELYQIENNAYPRDKRDRSKRGCQHETRKEQSFGGEDDKSTSKQFSKNTLHTYHTATIVLPLSQMTCLFNVALPGVTVPPSLPR